MYHFVQRDSLCVWCRRVLCLPARPAAVDLGAKNSKTRKKYDTESAWFWMLAGNTSTVTGATFEIAREVSCQHAVRVLQHPCVLLFAKCSTVCSTCQVRGTAGDCTVPDFGWTAKHRNQQPVTTGLIQQSSQ